MQPEINRIPTIIISEPASLSYRELGYCLKTGEKSRKANRSTVYKLFTDPKVRGNAPLIEFLRDLNPNSAESFDPLESYFSYAKRAMKKASDSIATSQGKKKERALRNRAEIILKMNMNQRVVDEVFGSFLREFHVDLNAADMINVKIGIAQVRPALIQELRPVVVKNSKIFINPDVGSKLKFTEMKYHLDKIKADNSLSLMVNRLMTSIIPEKKISDEEIIELFEQMRFGVDHPIFNQEVKNALSLYRPKLVYDRETASIPSPTLSRPERDYTYLSLEGIKILWKVNKGRSVLNSTTIDYLNIDENMNILIALIQRKDITDNEFMQFMFDIEVGYEGGYCLYGHEAVENAFAKHRPNIHKVFYDGVENRLSYPCVKRQTIGMSSDATLADLYFLAQFGMNFPRD